MMRRLALLLALSACSSEKVGPPPAPPVNWASLEPKPIVDAGVVKATERERGVASAYVKALGAPGFGSLATLLDENAHMNFGKQNAHGRDKTIKMHDTLFGAFDQRAVTASRVWLTDTNQTIEFTMTGVHARTWMDIAPTQKPVVIKGIALVWTQDEGTVSEIHVIFDVAGIKAQLAGSAPTPAPASPTQVFEETNAPDELTNVTVVRASLDALEPLHSSVSPSAKLDAGSSHDGGKLDAGALLQGEPAYLATMTDDFEVDTQSQSKPQRGKEEARSYFRAVRRAIAQVDTAVTNAWGVASYVVTEYSLGGEQVGPFGTIPFVREQLVTLNMIDIVEMRDGKMAHVWRYDNPDEVLTSR